VLERTAEDFWVLQQGAYSLQRIARGQRVRMEEEQDIAAGDIGGRVHQRRTTRALRPNQLRATRYCSFG
jgi:hypothetical protein